MCSYLEIINPIPLHLDPRELLQDLRPPKLGEEMLALLPTAQLLIEPKAVYTKMKVTSIENDRIQLENGHALSSVVLGDLLERDQEILAYVATIGPRLEEEAEQKSLLQSFLLDKVGNYAVNKACAYIKSHVASILGNIVSEFSPGSGTGELFAIEQQEPLFRILNPEASIEVRLSSLMMIPRKSASGVFAATKEEYVSCEHCPRKCESRRALYKGAYLHTRLG
jgi:hypothetical protein